MLRSAALLSFVLLPAVAGADRIHLENGKSFDDVVILRETADRIHFRLASGEMSLPLSWVAEVERERGPLEQYLERKKALVARPDAAGEAWLELARWARARNVGHGFRESLLTAAELEPELGGLAPLMASIDFFYKRESGVWSHGQPAPVRAEPPGFASTAGDLSPASEVSAQQEVAQGLTRAIERLAEAELERTRARTESREAPRRRTTTIGTMAYPIVAVSTGYAASGWVFRGVPLRHPNSDPKDPVIRKTRNPQARALLSRPPGSLLPLSAYQH